MAGSAGGFWQITFENLIEWGVNEDGEDTTEDDISVEYIAKVLENSPGGPE